MTKTTFTSRIAGLATLALAVLPMAALSSYAHAETRVKVEDLNLLTGQGVAAYHQRAEVAGRKFCRAEKTVPNRMACREGVRAELTEKFDALRQAQLAQQQQSPTFAAR